jgi:hypothetical protein
MMSKDMRLAVWNATHMHAGCIENESVLVNIASEAPLWDCPMQNTEPLTYEIDSEQVLGRLARLAVETIPRLEAHRHVGRIVLTTSSVALTAAVMAMPFPLSPHLEVAVAPTVKLSKEDIEALPHNSTIGGFTLRCLATAGAALASFAEHQRNIRHQCPASRWGAAVARRSESCDARRSVLLGAVWISPHFVPSGSVCSTLAAGLHVERRR